jgi:single-stranded-DNA-specific exonuclease
LLEPYGTGNHEPAFSARNVRLTAPPKILKDKHVKLKLKAGLPEQPVQREISTKEILAAPRCHPDGAAIRRSERTEATNGARSEKRKLNVVFDALAWHMAERLRQSPLLAGDALDIVFSISRNDHPEFGGIELELRDFRTCTASLGMASTIRHAQNTT